ncbi:hypothetical protein TVAG_318820 [Trichomonas vaginalis G3]|uniref:Uncharacterized protein n=1 Tax=Trichomonas vaginalis (strain ATCC PRA-98 / G3) TaxID=412133 RepID=A2EP60_TRIV3|nr:hypothetical protein TVAGG3_0178190 [Trichomonas vaginalis G3]EAY05527.1 hypothetical protein TVAG_318820 [Trichomonas vaginalis G3]KAI5549086.1 hypothetical protein TVAGG3_0178190 [Trichomonas vaginalis G3]|eukprot:XP_001317750.1 hypothetical protein [Trichomonas vaginalis G3]
MFPFLFAFIKSLDDSTLALNQLIVGEWNIYQEGVNFTEEPNYTIEFHNEPSSNQIVGSFWENSAETESKEFHDMDYGQLAQFVVAYNNLMGGTLIDFITPSRTVATFDFKMTQDRLMICKGKILNNYTYTMQITNQSISIFVSGLGRSEVLQFNAIRPMPVKKPGIFGKFSTIIYIIATLFVAQAILLCFCNCKKNQLLEEYEIASGQRLQDVRNKHKAD